MKIDTEVLSKKMERLDNCLSDYYPEIEVLNDKFDDLRMKVTKAMDEIIAEDDSRIMRMLYKQEIDDLKDVIEIASGYLSNIKETAEDLSFDVEDNWKVLMNED